MMKDSKLSRRGLLRTAIGLAATPALAAVLAACGSPTPAAPVCPVAADQRTGQACRRRRIAAPPPDRQQPARVAPPSRPSPPPRRPGLN